MANSLRHASAAHIAVELDYAADGVRVRVRDDGTGITRQNPAGFGLVGMRERTQRIGGELTVGSQVGGGTTVGVFVPAGRHQPGAPE